MLSNKTLQKLALILFLVTVPLVAILYQSGGSAIKSKNTPLYPSLVTDLGLLSKITIEDKAQTLTLVRDGETWSIAERNNYPVQTSSVQELVSSIAALKIVEPKTTSPALYSQLEVDDIDQPDSKAVKVTILDSKEQPIAQVLIGKRDGILIGEQYIERLFARKVSDQQTWLVQGILPLSNNVKDWLDQPLLGIVSLEQVKKLAITRPQATDLVIAKQAMEEQDFKLEGVEVSSGMKLDLDAINTLPFEISEFEILDVLPAVQPASALQPSESLNAAAQTADLQSATPEVTAAQSIQPEQSEQAVVLQSEFDWQQGLTANVETFDGVTVSLHVLKRDDQIFAKVDAAAREDVSPELKSQVERFNASHQAWYYKLAPESYKTLNLASSDFLQTDDQPEVNTSTN